MANLLSANFLRLRKSRLFWGLMLAALGVGGLLVLSTLLSAAQGSAPRSINNIFSICSPLIVLALSAFVPLFFGAEYSDGTIRSKLAPGHPRWAVYCAGLITSETASVLLCGAYLLAVFAAGAPLLALLSWDAVLLFLLGTLAAAASSCALYLLITLNCQRRALSAAACVLLGCLMVLGGIYLRDALCRHAETPVGIWDEAAQRFVWQSAAERGLYAGGVRRVVYQILYSVLPGCQAVQINDAMAIGETVPLRLPLYSLAAAALSTGAGIALFRKKDLK